MKIKVIYKVVWILGNKKNYKSSNELLKKDIFKSFYAVCGSRESTPDTFASRILPISKIEDTVSQDLTILISKY